MSKARTTQYHAWHSRGKYPWDCFACCKEALRDAIALCPEAQGEDATDDTRRLEYLESLVRNANAWHDIVLCWDHEDGFWFATVERGSHNGRALDTEEPSPSLRAAIDAARRGEGGE